MIPPMTRLADIRTPTIPVTCSECGHQGHLRVEALRAEIGANTDLEEILRRARCASCRARGQGRLSLAGSEPMTREGA